MREFNLKLYLFGSNLDPAKITEHLGIQPTSINLKIPKESVLASKHWAYEPDTEKIRDLETQMNELIETFGTKVDLLSNAPGVDLIQISFVAYQSHYNCAFMLTAEQLDFVHSINAQIVVDVYVLEDDEPSS